MHLYASQPQNQLPGGKAPGVSSSPWEDLQPPQLERPSVEVIGELMAIAQRIGGDFKMVVKVGAAGQGSFFDPVNCSITLDPLHIVHSPLLAKFVAGHEGSHRAITLNLTQIGMSEDEANFYLSHLGFHAGFNGCEDNAVNTWMMKVFPGMEGPINTVYNEMFCRPNVEVRLPAVEIASQKLGRYPLFGHYISEIIRDWHLGSFSSSLHPEVEATLRSTIRAVRLYTSITPDGHATLSERMDAMQRRTDIYRHDIWPELQRLVELDLKNEAEHQLLREILGKREELKRLKKERDGIRPDSDPATQRRRKDRIEQLENELEELDKAAGAPIELDPTMEKLLREAAERLSERMEELTDSIEDLREQERELLSEAAQLHRQLKAAKSRDAREKLRKELQAKQQAAQSASEALKNAEQELALLQQALQAGARGGASIDISKLSQQTREALSRLFSKLAPAAQQSLRNRAEEALKSFDDGVANELQGKLNRPNPTHADRDRSSTRNSYDLREYWKKRYEQMAERFEIDRNEMRRSRNNLVHQGVSPWERALMVVGDQVETLYLRLKRFFRPQEDPNWEPDYPSGGRLSLDRVMQSEADPRMLQRLWERRGIPQTFDYRFSFLVDISGSMQGAKAEETFKALVVLAEVLERLRIPNEIACFGSFFCNLKPFHEKLTSPNRLFTAQSLLSNGGGTMDAWAVRCAYKRLLKNLGKENFLIVMTDGESGMPDELNAIVSEISHAGRVKLMGLGLGPGTDFVTTSYPHGVANISMRLSQKEIQGGGLEFIDVVTILLEDMLKNPERYKG